MAKDSSIRVLEIDKIVEELKVVSPVMVEHILAHPTSEYELYYKSITHSDLCGGKRTNISQGYEKNILYYLTVSEMEDLGGTPVAHQSNIGIPNDVYKALGIEKKKKTQVEFKLVNDSAEYFIEDYTKRVVEILGKKFPWNNGQCKYGVSYGDFTDMHMTYGDHGFGTSIDIEFQSLRKNIFVNDTIYFLVERFGTSKTLYILLSKNPKFFDILNIKTTPWNTYLEKWVEGFTQAQLENADLDVNEYARRTLQEQWKELLAKEMMNYASSDSTVFCPLTLIKGNFEDLKMLFIASHIKRHSDSTIYEKYDINNGLLLSANADALFDKYMITIDENKNIIFSSLIKDEIKLIEDLHLNFEIFKHVLTDKRMEYMKEHRRIFYEKERERLGVGSRLVVDPQKSTSKITESNSSLFLVLMKDEVRAKFVSDNIQDIFVISSYKSIRHKKWILGNRMVTTSIKHVSDYLPIPKILILYEERNPNEYTAYRIEGLDYMKSEDLQTYPFNLDKHTSYMIYRFSQKEQVRIDLPRLLQYSKEKYQLLDDMLIFANV